VKSETRDCVFDSIIDGTTAAHFVLEAHDLVAFLDVRPVFPGHVLVVPRTHIETVADLPGGVAARLWDAAATVAAAPRRFKDGLRGFFWPRQRYARDDEAAAIAASIRAALAESSGPTTPARADVVIRTARVDDAPVLAGLLAGGSIRANEDPADPAPYRAALEEMDRTPGNEVVVAEVGGRVVGTCQLIVFRHLQERGGRCAEIESMHVNADMRGSGVGSVLLQAVIERARAAGCYRIQLTSNKLRPDAHRFYVRHGFTASHEGFKLYLE
jgi:GNAT superfamily N-acetyltransferase